MPHRDPLVTGEVYHVMNKSIAGYRIFPSKWSYVRMLQMIRYFSFAEALPKFSQFIERTDVRSRGFETCFQEMFGDGNRHVEINAYCLMPTHFHFVLRQARDGGVVEFLRKISDSYTRYFNVKYDRKGPLWVGRFKSVLVESDEQLLHLTRYVHLNAVTAGLVNEADSWPWSSYAEYINPNAVEFPLCDFQDLIDLKPRQYRVFVEDHVGYQREFALIKKLALE